MEVVNEVIAKAQQHADQMGPTDIFASICTLTACVIAGYQMIQHLRHFNEPQVQLQVIRILMIIPVSRQTTDFVQGILHRHLVLYHAP